MKLKNISLLLFLFISTSYVFSQEEYNKWSMGINVGVHHASQPVSLTTRTAKISHYGLNGRYMFNTRYGLMLDAGYDHYYFYNKNKTIEMRVGYTRSSIQGVINIADILKFDNWTSHIGFLLHGGFGVSTLGLYKETRNRYALPNNRDWMMNLTLGITPQIKITDRLSINADFSYITHIGQNQEFSMTKLTSQPAFKNQMINVSLGATFYVGKNAVHAEWNKDLSK